jgi:predicted metal-dependent TIM-barrel fold hydrolase
LAAFTHTTPIPKTHYYVEKEYISIDEGMPGGTKVGVHTVAKQIRELGAEHFILASDFGVYTLPTPVEGLREFIACMLDLGISPDEIELLVKRNPAKLLGMD